MPVFKYSGKNRTGATVKGELEAADRGLLGAHGRLGDAEVDDLDLAGVGDEHVLRRDVAVHEAELAALEVLLAMRVVERARQASRDQERQAHRHRLVLLARVVEDRAQVLALDELHGDEVVVVELAEVAGVEPVANIPSRIGDAFNLHLVGNGADQGGGSGHHDNRHLGRIAVGGRKKIGRWSAFGGLACQEVELHRKGITIGVERLLQGRYPVDRDDLPTRLKLFEGHDRPAGPVAPGCLQ